MILGWRGGGGFFSLIRPYVHQALSRMMHAEYFICSEPAFRSVVVKILLIGGRQSGVPVGG
jgi:hypothetical protein